MSAQGGAAVRARVGLTGYYRYLPFELPAGVRRIDLRVDTGLPAAVGIGLFDPRGAGYQSPGFRGVAGAERSEIFLATDDATPGFLPRPLPAGRWTVVVPVFAAIPFTTVRVDIQWTTGTAIVAPVVNVPDRVSSAPGWYRGDLHCHTIASSDAWNSTAPLRVAGWADACKRLDLDFAAMTDHNTVSQNRELETAADDVLLLAGEEMTNYFHGHALVAGLPSTEAWLDWRQRPSFLPLLRHERRIGAFYAAARSFNAFTAAAHPYVGLRSWQFMLDAMTDAALLPDGIEVWNGAFTSADRLALRYWDALLRRGRRLTATGGSDLHDTARADVGPGTPTTIVGARSLSRDALVDALRAGHVTVSAAPDGPVLHVEALGPSGQRAGIGDTLYGTDTDRVRVRVDASRAAGTRLEMVADGERVTAPRPLKDRDTIDIRRPIGTGGYVRFELRDGGWPTRLRALTNPVFLVNGRPPVTASEPAPPPPVDNRL